MIDEKLSWCEHINSLTKKISSLTGIIFRQRMHLPSYCKKNIYYSLAYSHIVYGILLCGNSPTSIPNPLVIRVNSLLRTFQGKRRSFTVARLYQEYNTLPVFELCKFYVRKLMHSSMYDHLNVPTVICDLFTKETAIHSHCTRFRSNSYHIPANVNRHYRIYWAYNVGKSYST